MQYTHSYGLGSPPMGSHHILADLSDIALNTWYHECLSVAPLDSNQSLPHGTPSP